MLTPAILGRIATALETITEELSGMTDMWMVKQLPKLERRAYRFWKMGRAHGQTDSWPQDQEHAQVIETDRSLLFSKTHDRKMGLLLAVGTLTILSTSSCCFVAYAPLLQLMHINFCLHVTET